MKRVLFGLECTPLCPKVVKPVYLVHCPVEATLQATGYTYQLVRHFINIVVEYRSLDGRLIFLRPSLREHLTNVIFDSCDMLREDGRQRCYVEIGSLDGAIRLKEIILHLGWK